MKYTQIYTDIRLDAKSPLTVRNDLLERVRFSLCQVMATGVRGVVHSVTSTSLRDCMADRCTIDRTAFRDVTIEDLGTLGPCETLDCFFERVTLKGKIGKLKIGIYRAPDPNDVFTPYRDAFYRDVDWALDVTEARFVELDLHADLIPPRLIRFDPTSQGIVTPAALARVTMARVDQISSYLASRVWAGLHFNPAGALIFVDLAARNRKQRQAEFDALKSLGLFAGE